MKLGIVICLLGAMAMAQVPQSKHIWLITEENHSYEDVIGNSAMPYYNSLASKYGLATQYYSVQHNSLGALMWLVAGQEVTTDSDPDACFNVNNLVRQFIKLDLSWKAYEEDLPYPGFQGLSYDNYVRRHNPLIDFTDSCAKNQLDNSVPYTQLAQDILLGQTPTYAYVTPNLNDDAHNGTLAQADEWLSQQVPQLLNLPEFQAGGDGLLFIVWDEGGLAGQEDDRCASNIPTGCGGRIATLVIGPQVRPGYQSTMLYSHYNLLSTVCAAMGITGCPGSSVWAAPMTDFFNTVNISTPFPNSNVASPVHLVATTNNDSEVYCMQVYVDNVLQYQTNGNSVDTQLTLNSGKHFIVVQSWDEAGGIHKTGEEVNVQAEAVIVTTPAPNAVVASPVTVTATAGGGAPISEMQIYVDDVLKYQVNGSTLNTNIPLTAGLHHIQVKALDDKGEPTNDLFDVTAAEPIVRIKTPAANSKLYSPIPLFGTTVDPFGVYAVQAYVDNTLRYQYSGTGIVAAVSIPPGQHSLVVQAWDNAKGIYKTQEDITIIPIVVTITSPKQNAQVNSPVQIVASVPSDSPVYAMQVYVDNQLEYQTNGKSVNTALNMSPGGHYIVVQAWDTGEGTWKAGVNVTVEQ